VRYWSFHGTAIKRTVGKRGNKMAITKKQKLETFDMALENLNRLLAPEVIGETL
jgi:hypothetical protein